MKVFLSWSGNKSHQVALVLREWLPSVIQAINPYVSSEDIDKGARWSTDISKELEDSTYGILCVTKENIDAPWLNFEAGALSKTMDKSLVSPFLFNVKRSEVNGPILQFQSTILEKDDIYKLLKSLNNACGEDRLPENRLDSAFDVWYPSLEKGLNEIKDILDNKVAATVENEVTNNESNSQILEELLETTRVNQKILRSSGSEKDEIIIEIHNKINHLLSLNDRKRIEYDRLDNHMFKELVYLIREESINKYYRAQILLSLLKSNIPWIYDIGIDTINIIKSSDDNIEKLKVIKQFNYMLKMAYRKYDSFGELGYNDIFAELDRTFRDLV